MTIYKVKIKSAITDMVWYYDKIGQTFEGTQHHTDSIFWFPGDVYNTPNGYIHNMDAEVIDQYESPVEPTRNN